MTEETSGGLTMGGGVTHRMLQTTPLIVERYAAIADAASVVGSAATRHLGTVGGNLCNASPAMETGSPLLVFDATVTLSSSEGDRTMPLAEFLVGPGATALRSGEILWRIGLPPPPDGRVGSAYLRLDYRAAMEIAVVGAAATVALDGDGRCTTVRVSLTAVAPTCVRAPAAEATLMGREPTEEVIEEAAERAGEVVLAIDDVRASALYREAMVPVVARRALQIALRRALGQDIPVPAATEVRPARRVLGALS